MASTRRCLMTPNQLDAVAWGFLASEFTTPVYADWPIDRRLDAFLVHSGREELLNDGTTYDTLLDHIMARIGPALRRGIVAGPGF